MILLYSRTFIVFSAHTNVGRPQSHIQVTSSYFDITTCYNILSARVLSLRRCHYYFALFYSHQPTARIIHVHTYCCHVLLRTASPSPNTNHLPASPPPPLPPSSHPDLFGRCGDVVSGQQSSHHDIWIAQRGSPVIADCAISYHHPTALRIRLSGSARRFVSHTTTSADLCVRRNGLTD